MQEMINNLPQSIRLIIASCLAALVIFTWQYFYVDPMVEQNKQEQLRIQVAQPSISKAIAQPQFIEREEILNTHADKQSRIYFDNKVISGSINLIGARLDDVVLSKYHKTVAAGSPNVILMSPSKTRESYFIEFGWLALQNNGIDLPDNKTVWQTNQSSIDQGTPVLLTYHNPQGVEFVIEISLDQNYMFKFKQRVINRSAKSIELTNYGLINRAIAPSKEDTMIIHEGAIGVFDGKLSEIKYDDISSKGKITLGKSGWLGFSDKYWLSAIIPTNSAGLNDKLSYSYKNNLPKFQASLSTDSPYLIEANSQIEWPEMMVFAGAKELDILDLYENKYNIKLFDRAVDFGILYFITKPMFKLLHYFYDLVGNFGIAILLLTVFIKLLLFPLAYKGFKGMNRLKDLQPKMAQLKEKFADDSTGFQRALIELYKKEKVNPMGGCLPIILQIPIFFALYKVLYVTIEMRHAPFFGWIHDLSAPDHLTIVNLFGLISFTPPSFLMIGIFPILMALTMFIQQRLNPEPSDPVQAKVMKFLPLIFLFMFSSFPSGLVIYWTWSNILSILQQVLIKNMTKSK